MKRILLAAVMVLIASSAYAQRVGQVCGPREQMASGLQKQYGEIVSSIGIDRGGRLVEVYVNPSTRTWSLVITTPGGPSCLVSAGEAWDRLDPKAPETDS